MLNMKTENAWLFLSILNMTVDDDEVLRQILLEVVQPMRLKLEGRMNLDSAILWILSWNGKIEEQLFAVGGF